MVALNKKLWRGVDVKHQLKGLIIFQLIAVASVLAYAMHNPLVPDHGLQQIDALSLNEQVSGLRAVDKLPTFVLFPGDQTTATCRDHLNKFLAVYGINGGLQPQYRLIVITNTRPPNLGQIKAQTDPSGSLAHQLALPESTTHCAPGYAILDGESHLRYRTYDPEYQVHAGEQNILLSAVFKQAGGMKKGNSNE